MRYARADFVILTELFDHGDTVTIDIINVDTDTLAISGGACTELTNMQGVFKYKFSPVVTNETVYVYEMSNGAYTKRGKFIFSGYLDKTVETIDNNSSDTNTVVNDDVAKKTDVHNASLL